MIPYTDTLYINTYAIMSCKAAYKHSSQHIIFYAICGAEYCIYHILHKQCVYVVVYCTTNQLTWVMFNCLSAIAPITSLATEQAGPRIISLVGCDGSVCCIRWYNGGTDEHCTRKQYYDYDIYGQSLFIRIFILYC